MDADQYRAQLGKVIQKRRKALHKSQEAFAEDIGLHRTYIGSVERGERNITIKNLVRIADKLGVKPSKLLSDVEKLQ